MALNVRANYAASETKSLNQMSELSDNNNSPVMERRNLPCYALSPLSLQPIEFDEAVAFVRQYHRHHKPPQGHKFSIAVAKGGQIVGVAIVGRPVARMLQDGWTLEVTRLATDGTQNACSILYGACWRVAREMGYKRLVTYILDTEPGTSLRAAGWRVVGEAGGGSWHRDRRARVDKHPLQTKIRYERGDSA